jgi:antirestriction protein ArdC
MILGNELGIGHDPGQHVAYVGSWIKVLQEDPLEIFRQPRMPRKSRLSSWRLNSSKFKTTRWTPRS